MTTKDSLNFSYVIPGVIAGMALPGRYNRLTDDITFIEEQGIGAILSLTEDRLPSSIVAEYGMRYLHIPVRDFSAPRPDQIERAVSFIALNARDKCATAVHCYAGIGRTGTIIACYLVSCGYTALEAIHEIRRLRPCSIQGDGQEKCVFRFERMKSN